MARSYGAIYRRREGGHLVAGISVIGIGRRIASGDRRQGIKPDILTSADVDEEILKFLKFCSRSEVDRVSTEL